MTVVNSQYPAGADAQQPSPTGWGLAAAMIGLVYIATPIAIAISDTAGDAVALAAGVFTIPIMLTRLSKASRLIVCVLIFWGVYAISAFAILGTGQGVRHLATTVAASGALLLFATYGREMLRYRWFRGWIYVLCLGGVAATYVAGLPKNITGGVILYLMALFFVALITNARRPPWRYVFSYLVVATVLGFLLDFRGMIAFASILVVGYLGAKTLNKRFFWFVGIVGSVAAIAAIIWYFLNVYTSGLARTITILVVDTSGRPATSGRDWLWPSIIDAVQHQPWFGLGAGTLPRDIMPTTLSSHSFYLQVYLQLGFVGIALLVMVLLAVWKPLAFSRTTVGQFGAAVFLMFVAHNATEVLMFQNALMVAIPAWCTIGIALSAALDEAAEARTIPTRLAAHERRAARQPVRRGW